MGGMISRLRPRAAAAAAAGRRRPPLRDPAPPPAAPDLPSPRFPRLRALAPPAPRPGLPPPLPRIPPNTTRARPLPHLPSRATVLGDPVSLARREGSFRVAFVFTGNGRASACVYSSETGTWGRLITAEAPCGDVCMKPSALVGDAVYWLLDEGGILELHLGKERLAPMETPTHAQSLYLSNIQLMEAEAGVLGFAGVKMYSLHLWAREADRDGTANWVLRTAINLGPFAPPPCVIPRIMLVPPIKILGVDEGGNFAFLRTIFGIFMLSLDGVLLKKVSDAEIMELVHPYSSFYVAEE
ncbi:hypothetical protein SETIT_9G288600v2 [Setaria italica]|uniref:F-box protein AT5G49610-like beta-propeller domain-containing protein n=1 Tax=Setaria italica TaxID=4555 RepID=A0A368SLX8_SETIT|nr:hypothetical protein SETIT_9G288600v2 [Setaria italica]